MKSRKKRRLQHRISVISISCVVLMLMVILGVGSISLHEKNRNYKAQEAQLQEQIAAEMARAEEIAELEAYVLAKIEERKAAKKAKDFAAADAIRDELLAKGIVIKDTREGVVWHVEA